MDLATVIGLVAAFGFILSAILMGGSLMLFWNTPGVIIVCGGSLAVTLMRFSLQTTFSSIQIGLTAFKHKPTSLNDMVAKSVELMTIARKDGLLGLENVYVENDFLARGVRLAVDGHEPDFVRKVLITDINKTIERHEQGQAVFRAIGDSAPAMGMIGTLVGLVQMMANMSDPKAIGPAMAVAILTTLYGAIISHAFAIPIADKLAARSKEERTNRQLIIETVSSLQSGTNPRLLEELLRTYLPKNQRPAEEW